MPGPMQELKIGPFSGGINSHADKSAIADAEMVDCINFDIDLDGSLLARPPWFVINVDSLGTVPYPAGGPTYSYAKILGTTIYNNVRQVYYQNVNADGSLQVRVYYVDGPSAGTSSLIYSTTALSKIVRYENVLYFIPAPDSSGSGASYDLTTSTLTMIAGMPGGNNALVYKSSLYIGGGKSTNRSRVFYSALANFSSWPAANFFDIAPGDGDAVQDFLIYQDNILIAKDTGTYVLAYDSSPLQAIVRLVNNYVGVKGPYCMVPYENSVFFATYTEVYEMINYDFTRVSTKVPFALDKTIQDMSDFPNNFWHYPVWASNVTDRLVCRFYNNIYVYHLRLRSWTRWVSADNSVQSIGPIFEIERNSTSSNAESFRSYVSSTSYAEQVDIGGGAVPINAPTLYNRWTKLLKFEDHFEGTHVEIGSLAPAVPVDIKSTLLTKVFDIGVSHRFKRLMHWGADVITSRNITGTLYPFSVSYSNTWAQLATYKWSQLNTWAYPLTAAPQTVVTNTISSGVLRRFVRFPKSLRFRLLQFQIDMVYSGNTVDGPDRLYTLTAVVGAKEFVPHSVN